MNEEHGQGKMVVVHTAGSAMEAMVVRSLLDSAGIFSPGFSSTDAFDPFPMGDPGEGFHGAEVMVFESQAEEARRIIAEHLQNNRNVGIDGSPENSGGAE